MTVEGVEIPERFVRALEECVERLPGDILAEYAKENGAVARGIRPLPANAALIRRNIARLLRRADPLEEDLALLLLAHHPHRKILATFSPFFISRHLEEFAQALGRETLLAGMLLHEELGPAALEQIRRPDKPPPRAEAAPARSPLKDDVSAALSQLNLAGAGKTPAAKRKSDPGAPGKRREESSELKKKAETLENRLKRQSENHKAKARHLVETRREAEKQLKEARDRLKRLEGEHARELKRREAENEALRREFGEQLEKKVAERLRGLSRKWLAVPEETAAGLKRLRREASGGGDSLARARKVLELQEKTDRHYGNRIRLAETLREREEALRELERAAREALNPLPELGKISSELAREISALKRTLGRDDGSAPLAGHFEAAFNAAGSIEELQARKKELEIISRVAGMIGEDDRRRLFRKYFLRMNLFYDLPVPPKVVDPLRDLTVAVEQDREYAIMVDGHNVMFALERFFAAYRSAGGHPGREAISRLEELMSRLVSAGKRLRATIFFDSDVHEVKEHSPRLRSYFSGGRGRHRADQAIIVELGRMKAEERAACCLVTFDLGLVEESARLGVGAVHPEALALLWGERETREE